MLKWLSNAEGGPGQGAPGSPQGGGGAVAAGGGGQAALAELLERLAQTEQLVTQLKELIREKDGVLRTKDEQLKAEKEACETKLSKMRLQNKAKVTSLTAKLEELKKSGTTEAVPGDQGTPTHSKKGGADGGEQASRGKILLLRRKVEELEHQLSQRNKELEFKSQELEDQRKRGANMDVMLAERDRKLSEKEAYIVHLQTGLASGEPMVVTAATPDTEGRLSPEENGAGALSELQLLVQSLTRKVGESEERYSLLQEQTESLKELLITDKATYQDKESMYKQNIQTFKDIILQKDNKLLEVNQMHEQELFKLAAKSDASADLEQLLKALKQKLHEKEEVLQGKNQVIDVLQGEVDARDQQIKELMERAQRLLVERESLGSKMEAEKHVMRAQLRDLLEKHQGELRCAAESHKARLVEQEQALRAQLQEELGRVPAAPQTQMVTGDTAAADSQATAQRIAHLEVQVKVKSEEASKSEAKFLKTKAWSKSRIRQLEDELRKGLSGHAGPDMTSLRSRITDLEEEREEVLWKLEQYEELKAKNGVLEAKLVVYEEQQRKMAADLEQVTKRAASQTSESGSADDTQSQVLDWQEMVSEAVSARDRAREEKASMALRMSHMEEEREALASRQQELEEELLRGPHRGRKKLEGSHQHRLQEDFEFDGKQAFHKDSRRGGSESTTPMEEDEGENMGGGLRSVVEELELERNQLQEQILGLEERCQDLEDRLQLQARIESLQSESERLHGQLSSLRNQQSRDAEKHQLVVTGLNEQLKGLSDTQECLETSLIEKENTLVKTSEKLELLDSLRDSLQDREAQHKEASDKLLQSEHNLAEVTTKCKTFEKQCSEQKAVVADLTQKLSALKEKAQKQEATIEMLQADLDQTNDELDKLNTTNLEERSQMIHDLQSCEREIDNLRDIVSEKDKELLALSGNMAEYAEQIVALKNEIKHKGEDLVRMETSLTKSERQAQMIRDSQSSDQQGLTAKMAELVEQLKYAQTELSNAKEENELRVVEAEDQSKQVAEDKRTILELRGEVQKHNIDHRNHLLECEAQISSLKEQVTVVSQKLQQSEGAASAYSLNVNQLQDKEQTYETELKSIKEERNDLLGEVAKRNSEMQILSTQLENQMACQEQLKTEVHEKLKKISFLEEQIRTTQEEAEVERQKLSMDLLARDSEKKKLTNDLQVELQQSRLSQLNEAMSLLQEQDSALRAGLSEKDIILQQKVEECSSLQNKLGQQKKLLSKLQGETKSLKGQCSQLTQRLEEREENFRQMAQDCEKHKDELNIKNQSLKSLGETSAKLESDNTELKTTLDIHETENIKLRHEMDQRQSEIIGLQNHIQALSEQNQQLRAAYEIRDKELAQQMQFASELGGRVKMTLEENTNLSSQLNSLTDEKNKLQQELNVRSESISELTKEKNSLQDKLSDFEIKHSENSKVIEGLLKDKKELNVTVDELKTLLVQNNQSISESVLQKTNECSNLTKLIRESEEACACMQQKVEILNIQLNQLNSSITEKDNTIKIQNSHIEAQQIEVSKLQETLVLLQEQVTTVKSGITEKDIMVQQKAEECSSLQNKLGQQKKLLSKLQGETKSLKGQCSQLTQRLEEREENFRQMAQDCEKHKDELNIKNESLKSLGETSAKLESENTELKTTLDIHETENIKLRHEMDQRQSEIIGLQNHIQALSEQNQQLRAAYEIRDKELAQQMQVASELGGRVKMTLEENTNLSSQLNSLTDEKNKLQQELNVQSESISELTKEKNSLQDKLSDFEIKHSENSKVIEGLLKDKKELNVTVDELKTLLVQNNQSISESVLQKTNECSDLTKLLRESEEACACMQQKVESLNIQLNQLNSSITEKDNTIKIQNSHIEAQQIEVSKLQETLVLLQEQVTSVKLGITEKDIMVQQKAEECNSLQNELDQQKNLLSKLHGENESLLGQSSQLTQRMEEKEANLLKITQDCKNHKDELSRTNESLKSLSSEIDIMKETHALLKCENKELKTSLDNHEKENHKLSGEMEQRQSEVRDLQDNIQTLSEQNVRLESEFQNSVSEASKRLEEISSLKCEILNECADVSELKAQLSTASLEKEGLDISLQQRDKSLHQQEMFIKQLEAQLAEGQGQMSHALIELQTHVQSLQKSLHDKDVSLHESANQLNLLREKFSLETLAFETRLNSNVEAMTQLQHKLNNSVEERNLLCVRVEEHKALLKQKVDDCVSLREKNSELEDSLLQLRGQVHSLTTESSLLKETLKEKDSVIFEAHRSSSAISEHVHIQLQAKDAECETLKEQVSHLKESVLKLNGSLCAQSSEVSRLQETLVEKGTALMDQSNDLQEMQRRADEAALFKTQFMESTELVSQLQNQIQELSVNYSSLSLSAEENQSAFVNVQEKFVASLEELQEAQKLLSERAEEIMSLNKALGDSNQAVQTAESAILLLRNESSSLHQELQQIRGLSDDLSKQKDDALATHQKSTSTFTVEIERLKSQYLHVAAQVNALTENLEQREMALHAINSQYTAQVKQTDRLLSEMQKLEDQNKKLREGITLSSLESQQKLNAAMSEKQHIQKDVEKLISESDDRGRSYSSQIEMLQTQMQQQSSNTNDVVDKLVSEKERLQVEVNVKDDEITGLKSDIEKMGQTLQDSEKEWLSVLDRETQDRNLEESKDKLSQASFEMKTKDSANMELVKEKDHLKAQLAKLTKEKELMKKKLQAALVVRKDLLKKMEEHENQKSVLQVRLQELTLQAEATAKEQDTVVLELNQQTALKDGELVKLAQDLSLRDCLGEQLDNKNQTLQAKLDDQEAKLITALHSLNEKSLIIDQLQSNVSEKVEVFEQERNVLKQELGNIQEDKKSKESLEEEMPSYSTTAVDIEIELKKIKQEKALIQKKAQAALQARKETIRKSQESEQKLIQELTEIKDNYNALMEEHSNQTICLNAVQLSYGQKVKEYEDICQTSVTYIDELKTLRLIVQERDKTLQDLNVLRSEGESQHHHNAEHRAELETLHLKLESVSVELANKEVDVRALEQNAKLMSERLRCTESQLEKKQVEIEDKMEEFARQQHAAETAKQQDQQEKQRMLHEHILLVSQMDTLQATVVELKRTLEAHVSERESFVSENKALKEDGNRLAGELDDAFATNAQISAKLQILQNTWSKSERQLNEEKDTLKVELKQAQSNVAETQAEMQCQKLHMESLLSDKESVYMLTEQLNAQLKEAGKVNKGLTQTISQLQDKSCDQVEDIRKEEIEIPKIFPEEHGIILKETSDALLISQALVTEKEEHISVLEHQLQRQIHLHEVAMEKMKTEVDGLQQNSQEDLSRTNETALLTRKLHAALVSRKEILKENSSLKEEVQTLSAKIEQFVTSSTELEMSLAKLTQRKEILETSVSSLTREKENLVADIDRILNDNHNLSAACESLKFTIESITQQKKAFSCQLESLKDLQTDELSECKSKHTELKQDYESLLQAYENVSSGMDKMRQLLEVTRKERQDAIFEAHKFKSEREKLEKQVSEMVEENEKTKENMRKFTEAEQQKVDELKKDNMKIKQDLLGFAKKDTVEELTNKNSLLNAEILSLVKSSEELRGQVTELQLDTVRLAEELKEACCSLEKQHNESKACEENLQHKLDDALNLNHSTNTQVESMNTELAAQQEIHKLMQNESETLSEIIRQMDNDYKGELLEKEHTILEIQEIINRHRQETIQLKEKVKILEDDKSLLQEELENVQEISDKVKNQKEHLETLIMRNSERMDEFTEAVNVLQAQNTQLSTQLTESKEQATQVCREKEQQQLKLVKGFEEKLKHFQRGNEGSKNAKKELQELLKEKHHEINQLQLDSIKYQELILDLERSLKDSESARERAEKEFKETRDSVSTVEEGRRHLESELTTHKNLLDEAKKDLAHILSEKDRLVEVVSENNRQSECQVTERTKALQNVAEQQKSIFMEREEILQQHIEELLGSKEKECQVVLELKKQIDSQDLQISTLKREADTNLAKLAALSSGGQGADALKQWNDMFLNTLHEKDSQLLEQGNVITRLLEEIRVKAKEANELQVTKSRLESALADYTVSATAQQRQLFIMGTSNRELNDTVDLLNQQLQELSEQIERLEQDKSVLNRHLSGSVDSTSKMEFNLQHLKETLANTESELLLSQSLSDKLQVDFEKQEAISLHLKSLLHNKEAEISSLLSSRDGQMSGYLEQLQANHCAQVAGFEERITALYRERDEADKDFRRLEHKVKSLQVKVDKSIQEKEQMAAQMETFRNSMLSLQAERERLVSEYRMSETRNQTGLQAKEGSVEGDVSAIKGLKHEIRTLLHQMDDLNSENAMLRAQLVRYREDLNQVLSLKDSQLKELLEKQQDGIRNLENQKTTAENRNRKTLLELETEREASSALKSENSELQFRITDLEAKVLALNMEKVERNEVKVIADLQQAMAAKSAECNDLQQKLFAKKVAVEELKRSMRLLESETENKLGEAEEKYNNELDVFEQEVELIRNAKENSTQRVSDLTRDLVQAEQLLSDARGQGQELKSQNESLGKAMAALQNNRDQLIEDFKILRNRYDEELRETQGAMAKVERRLGDCISEQAALTTERDILVQKISALGSKEPHSQLTALVDKLSVALSETEKQLKRVSLENDTYSRQVSAFSRSMASLQDDRDRLMEELAGENGTSHFRQRSGPEAVDQGVPSSRRSSNIEALLTERAGLETSQRVDELQRALQKQEAIKLQTDKQVSGYQTELAELRSERSRLQSECQRLAEKRKETVTLTGKYSSEDPTVAQLQTEIIKLQSHQQRCLYEIQQRDLNCQQLNAKLQHVLEEKAGISTQLSAVSQTLRDTQNRCYWLENKALPNQHNQSLGQQGAVGSVEVAPGAPQERSCAVVDMDAFESGGLRTRLAAVEQNVVQLTESLSKERARRETAEEALGLAEERANSVDSSPSKSSQRDFSIQLDVEEEWEALIMNPNEPLITRKVKGGVLACRRWLRGRSLYCSKLLTSRARSRYLFLTYLLLLHVAVLMCLTGAL
ncbi:hypothetical protein DPEC_G00252380 [Dallia pectoralis]|uniref:Uncharacterized protein n=1 Tax=Dallia pectoralis TaxID=75939 RepID=A0ACC2FTP9_DALPE|nr:hypothetical protein DPEC_G00252380 [Dallia pectoralis]